jgi:hypothetical protein
MAMNWGAFAGGAASSALGTYSQLNSERMKNLQTALFMEDMAEKQQMKQAAGETFGKVGQDQYENINSVLAQKGAEVSPEAIAVEKPAAPTKYTEQQAATDYGMRLSAIDPVRGFQFKGQALQYKSAKRQADYDDKYDALNKWLDDSLATGYSSLINKGMEKFPDEMNPHLKDAGIQLEFKGSDAGPGVIYAKDSKGKVVGTYAGPEQVTTAFKDLIGKEYERRLVGLLGSADKALNYVLQREKVDLDRARTESEVLKNRAMAGAYNNRPDTSPKARINEYATALVDAGTINPKTNEPYTQTEAKAYAAGIVLRDPNLKPERVNPVKQNALDYGEMMFESGYINPVTKKPFETLAEAQKYAMGVALKDPAQAADTKQLTEMEKIMLPKWQQAVAELGPKPTDAQLISLAKRMGIRPSLVNLPEQTQLSSTIGKIPFLSIEQGGIGAPKNTNAPASEPKQTPPRAAIPPASAAPVPLPERIAQAVRDPQALATLAYEAQQQIPILQAKIANANKVIPNLPKDAQDRMNAQIEESQRMLQLYQGVLQQRAAKTGLPN